MDTQERQIYDQDDRIEGADHAATRGRLRRESESRPKTEVDFRLFHGANDLMRGIIMTEVLGPPVSRRTHRR